MSWRDDDRPDDPYRAFGRPGGDWQGLRPRFDNPMTWSIRIGRLAGITVRVHLFLLIFVVVMLLRSLPSLTADDAAVVATKLPFMAMVIAMAAMFVLILVHEFGHCIACRTTGGHADEILMWPLGGLAMCLPRQAWRAHLATAVGGPLVNVVFCLVGGVMLFAATGVVWGVAIPNPIDLLGPMIRHDLLGRWSLMTVYIIHWISWVLLLFNLLPMFPLDGGRILQALLWPKLGYARSMRVAVRTGIVGAVGLAVFGLVVSSMLILCIAVFGAAVCYISGKQLQDTAEFLGYEAEGYGASLGDDDDVDAEPAGPSARERRRAEKARAREADEAARVDAILQKINRSGLDSLTGAERRLLKQVTERKQKER